MSDGNVLVNDPARQQVLLLDSAMKVIRVVADTSSATQKAYGSSGGGLLAYHGDSTLFVDPASYSMLVIDPGGSIIRVIAAPRPEEVSALLGGPRGGNAGFDSNGMLVYRNASNFAPRAGQVRPQAGERPPPPPQPADSSPIVRFNLATRKEDTAAFVRVETTKMIWVHSAAGERIAPIINPLQLVDDWALLPDGTIAILRKNYHVDFITPDGAKSSGSIVQFPWQRLSDSAKIAFMDSVKKGRSGSSGPGESRTGMAASGDAPARMTGGRGGNRENGGMGRRSETRTSPTSPIPSTPRPSAPSRQFVEPGELPDYKPAFASGALHADAEGKLWVRIITSDTASGPQYDVLDRAGNLTDCVVTPKGTTIAAFGPNGTVYLGVRDRAGVHLVRAREK
jgi:hypothetical protein